jgi:phosphatidylinositol phospholipase C, beta
LQLEPGHALPSPSLLKNKILIKNKRMKPEVEKAEMELFLKGELKTDDDAKEDATATVPTTETKPGAAESATAQSPEAAAIAAHTGSTTNVHPWLSSLVNYAEPIHFNGFANAESKGFNTF